jgi:GAF domain-containing protein
MNQFSRDPQLDSNLDPALSEPVQNSKELLPSANNRASNTESEPQSDRDLTPPSSRDVKQGAPETQGKGWGLSSKMMVGAVALSAVPLLVVAGILSWNPDENRLASDITPESVQQDRQNLGFGVGVGAIAVGAIAAFLTQRATRSVVRAANTSNYLVNRLRQESVPQQDRVLGKDELIVLESNLRLLSKQLPVLLSSQEVEAEHLKVLMDMTRLLQASRSEEDLLRTAVTEVRQRFRTERVTVFQFQENGEGIFVEESVGQGWPKLLWSTVHDPCFSEGYIHQYREGRVRAIDNIYEANLGDCHVGLLERFRVKANLVAPIIRNEQLFGLLIAHQCSAPRFWQSTEIDLFAQISSQIGFALDRVRLLEQIDTESNQSKVLANITRQIRASLIEDDVLKTTVAEVRRAFQADRVIVYSFDDQWYGTVVAEAVLPGYPKALWAKIKDPCFIEGYVDQYREGRVQATPNIELAGLTSCHLKQLEPFAVRANLVAPILKDDKLFGLLIAHQCSGPRDWQATEVDLFAQIAIQVGFALEHARLLNQVEQAYQGAEFASESQRHLYETLQQGVIHWLDCSEPVVKTLSEETMRQMESITTIYQHLKTFSIETQVISTSLLEQETQGQKAQKVLQEGQNATEALQQHLSATYTELASATQRVQELSKPTQKLSEVTQAIYHITSQMKLQAMNAALEATRMGDSTQEFAGIGEKVLDLARQLEGKTVDLTAVAKTMQAQLLETVNTLESETQQIQSGLQLGNQTEQALVQVIAANTQLQLWMQSLVQSTQRQSESSVTANQMILEVAAHANQVSEQAIAIASTLEQLNVLSHRETLA